MPIPRGPSIHLIDAPFAAFLDALRNWADALRMNTKLAGDGLDRARSLIDQVDEPA